MAEFTLVGIAGMVFIILAFAPLIYQTIRSKSSGVDPRFEVLYLVGSVLLIAYSFFLMDPVFIVLNAMAAISAGIGLYFTLHKRLAGRKRQRL